MADKDQDQDNEHEHEEEVEHDGEELLLSPENIMNIAFTAKRRPTIYDESSSNRHSVANFVMPFVKKSPEVRAFLYEAIENNILFSHLTIEQVEMVVNALKLRKIAANYQLYSVNDLGDRFYIVERGEFHLTTENGDTQAKVRGDSFGEVALLFNCRRETSAVNLGSSADVWIIDRDTFRHIIATYDAAKRRRIRENLKKIELLKSLSDDDIAEITDIVEAVRFKNNQKVIRKGEVGNIFYMLVSGEVKQVDDTDERLDVVFGPGSYFGERALLMNVSREVDFVVASAEAECLALDREAFDHHLGKALREKLYDNMGLRVLKAVPLLSQLSTEERKHAFDAMITETFADGDLIIKEGEPGAKFYIIKEGKVRIVKNVDIEQIGRVTVSTLHNGDYFGEASLLSENATIADFEAIGAVSCFVLNKETFLELFAEVKKQFRKTMREREREIAMKISQSALETTAFELSDLDRVMTLGIGAMGRVLLVQHKQLKTGYAMKVIMKQRVVKKRQVKSVMMERELLMNCDHPFILTLFKTFQDEHSLYFLTEFIQGGELFTLLNFNTAGKQLRVKHHRFYSACILSALEYLHANNVVYRDLKPENVLIDNVGYLRLVDLGSAKRVYGKTSTRCGTAEYLAPEIVLHKSYNHGVDYWAFGVIVYEMIAGKSPFRAKSENFVYKNIIAGVVPFYDTFPSLPKDLISKLIIRKASARLGMQAGGTNDIKQHPWLAGMDWARLEKKKLKGPWIPKFESPLDVKYFPDINQDFKVEPFKKGRKKYPWDEEF